MLCLLLKDILPRSTFVFSNWWTGSSLSWLISVTHFLTTIFSLIKDFYPGEQAKIFVLLLLFSNEWRCWCAVTWGCVFGEFQVCNPWLPALHWVLGHVVFCTVLSVLHFLGAQVNLEVWASPNNAMQSVKEQPWGKGAERSLLFLVLLDVLRSLWYLTVVAK